jgi:hypothetical protein
MRTCFLDLHVSDENLAVGKVERFDAENQKAVTRGLREEILGKILGEIRGKRGGRRVVVAGHHAILHRGTHSELSALGREISHVTFLV